MQTHQKYLTKGAINELIAEINDVKTIMQDLKPIRIGNDEQWQKAGRKLNMLITTLEAYTAGGNSNVNHN